MTYKILDEHEAIAWDFDGTLFDHRYSHKMHDYIRAHPEKKHVIVTFRSGLATNGKPWVDKVWEELGQYQNPLTKDHFHSVINMSEETFDTHGSKWRPGGIIIDATAYYTEWKGQMCHENGLTVLVDDNGDHTIPGCTKYGIVYIDPENLF